MLVIRLILEIYCIVIELELNVHHSQKSNFPELLTLNEKWLCPVYSTNLVNTPKLDASMNQFLPAKNRSILFHRSDTVTACEQQAIFVTCWIKESRMKSYGIKFMFTVICLQTWITVCELLTEIVQKFVGKRTGFLGK